MCVLLLISGTSLGAPAYATDATQLYIGHSARLTAHIPFRWIVDPSWTFDYTGPDGYVRQ